MWFWLALFIYLLLDLSDSIFLKHVFLNLVHSLQRCRKEKAQESPVFFFFLYFKVHIEIDGSQLQWQLAVSKRSRGPPKWHLWASCFTHCKKDPRRESKNMSHLRLAFSCLACKYELVLGNMPPFPPTYHTQTQDHINGPASFNKVLLLHTL